MKKILTLLTLAAVGTTFGCAHIGTPVDLEQVAQTTGMTNVTTGDGTFENYQATSYNQSLEVGISVGIPFLWKVMEVYPAQSNEAQLAQIANEAKEMGATAMINVQPPEETYTGFPFFFVGLHFDRAHGTGINAR